MGKRIITGYVVFCAIFFTALFAIIAIRVITTWDRNLSDAKQSFGELRNDIYSSYLGSPGFAAETFLQHVRMRTAEDPRLVLLSIYSRDDGILYLKSVSRAFVRTEGGDWQDGPEYRNLPLGSTTLSLAFSSLPGSDLGIDGVYVLIGKGDIFPIVKDTFIMLFLFLITTMVVMLVIPTERAARRTGDAEQSAALERAVPERTAPPKQRKRADIPRLLPEVESKNLFSPETGLGWKSHLPQRLKFEIDRAASFDQDLTLALITLGESGDGSPEVYTRIARMLLEDFTFQDLIFEYGGGSYAVILPDTDIAKGVESLEAFQNRVTAGLDVKLLAGLSARNGRLMNGATLLSEASNALKRANPNTPIIAFKADPQKYRQLIGQKS